MVRTGRGRALRPSMHSALRTAAPAADSASASASYLSLAASTASQSDATRPSVLSLGAEVDRSELRFAPPAGYGDGTADEAMQFTAGVEQSSRAGSLARATRAKPWAPSAPRSRRRASPAKK